MVDMSIIIPRIPGRDTWGVAVVWFHRRWGEGCVPWEGHEGRGCLGRSTSTSPAGIGVGALLDLCGSNSMYSGVRSTDTGWESFQSAFNIYQRLLTTGARVNLVTAVGCVVVAVLVPWDSRGAKDWGPAGCCLYSPVMCALYRDA